VSVAAAAMPPLDTGEERGTWGLVRGPASFRHGV